MNKIIIKFSNEVFNSWEDATEFIDKNRIAKIPNVFVSIENSKIPFPFEFNFDYDEKDGCFFQHIDDFFKPSTVVVTNKRELEKENREIKLRKEILFGNLGRNFDVFIKDIDSMNYAYIWNEEGIYEAYIYREGLDEAPSSEEAIEYLNESNTECHYIKKYELIDIINDILDFWAIPLIRDYSEVSFIKERPRYENGKWTGMDGINVGFYLVRP